MADYSAQIAALEEALASGAKRITFMSGGTRREVEYHSLKDMMDALDRFKAMQKPRSRITLVAL